MDFSLISARVRVTEATYKPPPFTPDGVEVQDGDTVEVDRVNNQYLEMDYSIANAAGLADLLWDNRVTVYNLTDNIKVGSVRSDGSAGQGGPELPVNVALGKITKPVTFRINIMANHDHMAALPDVALWRERA